MAARPDRSGNAAAVPIAKVVDKNARLVGNAIELPSKQLENQKLDNLQIRQRARKHYTEAAPVPHLPSGTGYS
jgi:hypothetical protein